MSMLIGLALTVAVFVLYGTWHYSSSEVGTEAGNGVGNETAALVWSVTDNAASPADLHASAVVADMQTGGDAYGGVDRESTGLVEQVPAPAKSSSTGSAPLAPGTLSANPSRKDSDSSPKDTSSTHKPLAFSLTAADRGERAAASGQVGRDAAKEPRQDEPARYPSGQFIIAGRVLDEDGYPVPGIELVARAQHLFGVEVNAVLPDTLPEYVAYTGPDGGFVFQGLADGDYLVSTQAIDGYADVASQVTRAGNEALRLMVVAQGEAWVGGMVENTLGEPLAGVQVTPLGQPERATWSDASGYYTLGLTTRRNASYSIWFQSADYRAKALNIGAEELQGATSIILDVTLEPDRPLTRVSGSVTSGGSPLAGEQVYLKSSKTGRKYSAETDSSGRFTFTSVESGADYILWVSPPAAYQQYRQNNVEIPRSGLSSLDIVLERQGAGSLFGQMIDFDGNPVPNFTLFAQSAGSGQSPLPVTGDAQGYFFLGGVPTGRVSLQTNSLPKFAVSGIEVPAGSEREVELILDVGRYALRGQVLDSNGTPVPAANALLTWVYREDGIIHESIHKTVSAADGRFSFMGLGPGERVITVAAPGFETAKLSHEVGFDGEQVVLQLTAVAK